ncbi:hypothetical protein [Brachybacterium sacelli]|uniref:Uncharacterized protein n=1 Tax=Brachybacterium sacelli TaxID=173364 RepID=A0ABS4WVE6_9MICO|nr:hypothetical protein [Brachybacterium sacelli]MBP2380116.1 hypothetical protein [Brachybacterium sacelli]
MTSAPQQGSSAPSFSADDVRIATELLSRPLTEPVTEIVTLTDEELTALDGLQHESLTPTPWLSESAVQQADRALATSAAMRSMMARGIVASSTVVDPRRYEEGSHEPARMLAVPELQGVAVLRRTSDAVIIAERRTERGTAYGYFYVFHVDGGVRVLWEAFDADGFHLFFLLEGDVLAEQLIAFVDPIGGIGEADGEVEEVPAAQFGESPTAARLAGARAVTTVLVLHREAGDPAGFTLLATPEAVELMETDAEGDEAVQRVGAVSRQSLTAILEDVVAGTAPEADPAAPQ